MFGSINPKKMHAMMKQMGIGQEEINAERVIIEKAEGNIVINNPTVVKISMQGNDSFQISGDIHEESAEGGSKEQYKEDSEEAEEESEAEQIKEDVQSIVEQTGVSEDIAAIELEKNNGDIAETIIQLSKKEKGRKK